MSPVIAGYRLDDRGIVVRFPARQGSFGSFKHSDRNRSPRSLLYSVYCGHFPKRLKRPQNTVKHVPFSARLKISRALYPVSHMLFVTCTGKPLSLNSELHSLSSRGKMWKIFLVVDKFMNKTYRHSAYNKTVSCFCAATVALEKQYIFHILSVYL